MAIVQCMLCENEFESSLLKYDDQCPYAYCYSRGETVQFKLIK